MIFKNIPLEKVEKNLEMFDEIYVSYRKVNDTKYLIRFISK